MIFVYFTWYLYIIHHVMLSGTSCHIVNPLRSCQLKKISADAMSQAKEVWPLAQCLLPDVKWGLWESQCWESMTDRGFHKWLRYVASSEQRNTHVLEVSPSFVPPHSSSLPFISRSTLYFKAVFTLNKLSMPMYSIKFWGDLNVSHPENRWHNIHISGMKAPP